MIILAAISIIVTAIHKWLHGLELQNLGGGTIAVALGGATAVGAAALLRAAVARRSRLRRA